jgi:predicted aspartyl protease
LRARLLAAALLLGPLPASAATIRVPIADNECLITAHSGSHSFIAEIDTGADSVYLNRQAARALGLKRGHEVRLRDLSISGFRLRNVEADFDYSLDVSLIGMAVLGRLARFEASHGMCSLTW